MSTCSPVTTTFLIRHWATVWRSAKERRSRLFAQQVTKVVDMLDHVLPVEGLLLRVRAAVAIRDPGAGVPSCSFWRRSCNSLSVMISV